MNVDRDKHFAILDEIARNLCGHLNFPTCLDAAVLVRNVLHDPSSPIERVSQVVAVEPLISSKLLRLANSASYNPSGKPISDISSAISRLGFEVVRTTSLAVALDQMLRSRNLAGFSDIARNAWEHSLQVAAISRVLARRLGRINPDQAMLAGLVHDIGIFYLLYTAAEYPEYSNNRQHMLELLMGWHDSIGESLLYVLGLPENITSAIRDHDRLQNVETPCSISDVLYFANLLAGSDHDWLNADISAEEAALREADRERFADLIKDADEDIRELRAALSS